MIVGQRPGASPRVLIIIIALLAAAWVAREAIHRSAPETRPPSVATGATRPASVIVSAPPSSRSAQP